MVVYKINERGNTFCK